MKLKVKDMDGLLKENGSVNIITTSSSASNNVAAKSSVTSVQSVIQQSNQQSVIQTVSGPTVLTKGNIIIVGKPNSVIQTAQGNLQTLHVMVGPTQAAITTDDEDSLSPPTVTHSSLLIKKRHSENNNNNINNNNNSSPSAAASTISRIKLEHNNNNNNLNNDLCVATTKMESSGSEDDSNLDSELSSHSLSMSNHYHTVGLQGGDSLSIASQNNEVQQHSLSSITMSSANSSAAGTILHYAGQDGGQFFMPGEIVVMQNPNGDTIGNSGGLTSEDPHKKRELRLLKNREAARECRRKKKEYIKCLENRVAVLETQNKALIDELKSLKELYCLQKSE